MSSGAPLVIEAKPEISKPHRSSPKDSILVAFRLQNSAQFCQISFFRLTGLLPVKVVLFFPPSPQSTGVGQSRSPPDSPCCPKKKMSAHDAATEARLRLRLSNH